MPSHESSRASGPSATPIRDDRRRRNWREFRQAYPGILATMTVALAVLLAMDGWLVYKRVKYTREINRLRAGMTTVERRRTDMVLASNERRLEIMLELIRRQAQGDQDLHLSVSVDSSKMLLEREGARLREMQVDVGDERSVGTPPDTVRMAAPRGARTIERILGPQDIWEVPRWVYLDRGLPVPDNRRVKGALGPAAVMLNGGTVLYTRPSTGPLADSAYVLPGSIRARTSDLRAIAPNLKAGTNVYFY